MTSVNPAADTGEEPGGSYAAADPVERPSCSEDGGGGGGGGDPDHNGGARARLSGRNSGSASPNYLKWSESLQMLLNDSAGQSLLMDYLEKEDADYYLMVKFWLAVRGSNEQQADPKLLDRCIRAIEKFLYEEVKGISEDLKQDVKRRIRRAKTKNMLLDARVFSEVIRFVEGVMNDRMYPNFLNSSFYLDYVHSMQEGNVRQVTRCSNTEYVNQPLKDFSTLPVVKEHVEWSSFCQDSRPGPRSVTYSSASTRHLNTGWNKGVNLPHLSYVTVSRQNSELQSLSSGGRTESMSDLAMLDDIVVNNTYAQKRRQLRLNKNVEAPLVKEPRSSLPGMREKINGPEPIEFMNSLLPKLEKLKKNRDALTCVKSKLDSIENPAVTVGSSTTRISDDDNDQAILDQHVSRIFSETPKESPTTRTPTRPKSPEGRRTRSLHGSTYTMDQYRPSSYAPSGKWSVSSGSLRRRDKDGVSLFSIDSGNGSDRDHHHRSLHRYKSASDCGDSSFNYSGHLHPHGGDRTWSGSHRTMTDSGVSVAGSAGFVQPQRSKDSRMTVPYFWQKLPGEKSRPSSFGSGSQLYDEREASMFPAVAMQPPRTIRNKSSSGRIKSDYAYSKSVKPAQPFVQDTNMPPYPYYNIDPLSTVVEVTRRLEAWKGTRDESDSLSDISSHDRSHQSLGGESLGFTSVVYNFADENVPYLLKLPLPITLRTFKDHAPKKGNFRYFFQTECEELGGDTPIFEEITDNDCELPLWNNKVISKITIQ